MSSIDVPILLDRAETGETCYVAGHLGRYRFLSVAILTVIDCGFRPVLSF